MIPMTDPSQCCGCTACYSVCPQHCISMSEDAEGFLYPKVDPKKCIGCNQCEVVCSYFQTNQTKTGTEKNASDYAAIQHADEEKRASSTAGGVFSLLADAFISEGAYVYAVGYGEDMIVCHKSAQSPEDLKELRGSKYVQSTLGDTFRQIEKRIRDGETVFFTGTPCQVHGLKNLLGDPENLFTMDLLCLGVSSPGLYQKWIDYLQKKYQDRVIHVQFRNKRYGYGTPNVRIYFSHKTPKEQRYETRVHSRLFFDGYNVRPSCYDCLFRSLPRVSDWTIGDFTDIEKDVPEMNDFKGTTRTWIHTAKGRKVLEKVNGKARIRYLAHDAGNILGGARKQMKIPSDRMQFWKDASEKPYGELISIWKPKTVKDELIGILRPLLNQIPLKYWINTFLRKKRDLKFVNAVSKP